MKTCRRCFQAKPIEEFCRDSKAKDGKNPWCRGCHSLYKKSKNPPIAKDLPPDGHKCCYICKDIKPFEDFYTHNTRPGGYRAECIGCTRLANAMWKDSGGREYGARYSKNRKFNNMVKIVQYLLEHPCVDCGDTRVLVLEFDHVRDKTTEVMRMISGTWEAISSEIAKCEVRCASCHKIKTAERKMSLRLKVLRYVTDEMVQ